MKEIFDKPLFIFEMANNHMGRVEHGLKIIDAVAKVCKEFDFHFAFKLQYRDLDTFIHPEFKDKTEYKYIKRFSETRLSEKDFKILRDEISRKGFISVCTPFDEKSVDLIEKHNYDVLKIASCSFTDWPLLEKAVEVKKQIIISTAGASLEKIDRVVSFLKHRDKKFVLMHCVGEYPVLNAHLELNQIDFLKKRYPGIDIGYSTHEPGDHFDAVKIAVAKGARFFEKHVGLSVDGVSLNAYSAAPDQLCKWLDSAREAFMMCGVNGRRYHASEKEVNDLMGLRRGMFVKTAIKKGEKIDFSKVFFAIPIKDGQVSANDTSKYSDFFTEKDMAVNEPVLFKDVKHIDSREKIYHIVSRVKDVLKKSNLMIPSQVDLEVSYQYGIENFDKFGGAILNFINRAYCKKLIVLLPGQTHPEQYHKEKEETFNILYGDITIILDGVKRECKPGDMVLVEKGVKHSFSSRQGGIIEEISSTHYKDDSYYTDARISKNSHRKTYLTYWMDKNDCFDDCLGC